MGQRGVYRSSRRIGFVGSLYALLEPKVEQESKKARKEESKKAREQWGEGEDVLRGELIS